MKWLPSWNRKGEEAFDAPSPSEDQTHTALPCLVYAAASAAEEFYGALAATSPTLGGVAPANVHVAVSESTSVTVAMPSWLVTVLITLPVVGSLTVRTGRLMAMVSPTRTPTLLPMFRMRVAPLTSATSPEYVALIVGSAPA